MRFIGADKVLQFGCSLCSDDTMQIDVHWGEGGPLGHFPALESCVAQSSGVTGAVDFEGGA